MATVNDLQTESLILLRNCLIFLLRNAFPGADRDWSKSWLFLESISFSLDKNEG